MKLLVEANNILSLITGSSRDLTGMKDRVKRGYEGDDTAHVHAYDEPGFRPQDRSARIQLDAEDPPFSDISAEKLQDIRSKRVIWRNQFGDDAAKSRATY
jgi:hypothetical protein